MAEALVGGAFLSAFLNVLLDRMASRQVVNFFRGQKVNNRLLERLETAMRSASRVLDDAEEKQITSTAVWDWLAELKDAVYKADDFLDAIAYKALRQELKAEDQTFICHMQRFLSFFNLCKKGLGEIEEELKVLLQDLDRLVDRTVALGLISRTGKEPSWPKTPGETSLVDERGVYGRDDDKEAILKLLLSDDANGQSLGVVRIVGMGGVGKTTLAQLVYNHSEVQRCFNLKAWVCVSEDFSVSQLTKVILEEVGSKSDFESLNQLQIQLKEKLREKKFLLVLDDVWEENYAEWDRLLTPLKSGAQGSMILVTTRHERVASVMPHVPTHHLKELAEDSCWSLFAKHAFGDENPKAPEELQEIGRAIARKCKGLPLAAKSLGGLLCNERDVEKWRGISESNLWDLPEHNILPALRLSYHHLPSHLKQCFAYCAIFPKDYEFEKDELVLLWMAEGFLVHSVDDEMERAGAECFDDLLSRSFFQQSSASPSLFRFQQSCASRSLFVMHDLMHDLATHVSGQFCFSSRLGVNNSSKATRRTRHLSLVLDTEDTDGEDTEDGDTEAVFSSTKLENIRKAQHLRTFRTSPHLWMCPPEFYKEIFRSTHCRLRVLFMTNCKDTSMLSCSTSKLKHLRYLDLSGSDLVTLPEKVSALLNLQTLILKWCRQLARLPDLGNLKLLRHLNLEGSGIKRLPESLERLINLRYLNISYTPLKEMPPHIGQLTKLRTLTDFLVGRQSETTFRELGKLQHLRGELHIRNLQNVVDARDAGEANLKGKKHLDKLRFTFTWDGETHDPQHVRSTLEKLEPNRKVKDLEIDGYGGRRFPEWVGKSTFSKIVSLKLSRCENCTSLPPLGQLASLEELSIKGFCKVVTVGSEFYGNCTAKEKPFKSLKTLRFEWMPEWREWISDEGSREAFPLLESLSIGDCENLAKALPSHNLPRLTSLIIEGCHSLESLLEEIDLIDLEEITIKSCASLKCVELDLLPKLNSLDICGCSDLESLCAHERPLNDLTSLRYLEIQWCPKLVSFPKGGLPAPVLTRLVLNYCNNLKQLPESMHSLLPSLIHLEICDCRLIESMPEEGLPSSLSYLRIDCCPMLKSLPRLQHLTTLRELKISECPLIESMPEEGLPSSLSYLYIYNCPMLGESCEREKGKDWPKISHIPRIDIWSS
ncbi:hypothetical protein NC651_009539 [Populus alba x Populus x berolinensis]|nr:hypothetical protein NC651_009539 [Populus alba x Populus x berolinensis]